jgi:hypothetical protein
MPLARACFSGWGSGFVPGMCSRKVIGDSLAFRWRLRWIEIGLLQCALAYTRTRRNTSASQ